eukprot:SAG31_NODE_211_length_20274_cov_40.333482_1_plen_1107_part_10
MAATTLVPALREETTRANLSLSPVAPPSKPRPRQSSPRTYSAPSSLEPHSVWARIVHQLCASTGPGAAEIGRAMSAVDRRNFVPPSRGQYACKAGSMTDQSLATPGQRLLLIPHSFSADLDVSHAIGHGATIESPSVHALSLALLHSQLCGSSSVVDIGSGSGYMAAVMAAMVAPRGGMCTSFNSRVELCDLARQNSQCAVPSLLAAGCLRFVQGSWVKLVDSGLTFDVIHIGVLMPTVKSIPKSIFATLNPGGRLMASVGSPGAPQNLVVIDCNLDGFLEPPLMMSKVWSSTSISKVAADRLDWRGVSSLPLRADDGGTRCAPLSLWNTARVDNYEDSAQNMMFDRRIRRGNTHQVVRPPSLQHVQPRRPRPPPTRVLVGSGRHAISPKSEAVTTTTDVADTSRAECLVLLPAPDASRQVQDDVVETQAAAGTNLVADVEDLAKNLAILRDASQSKEAALAAAHLELMHLRSQLQVERLRAMPFKQIRDQREVLRVPSMASSSAHQDLATKNECNQTAKTSAVEPLTSLEFNVAKSFIAKLFEETIMDIASNDATLANQPENNEMDIETVAAVASRYTSSLLSLTIQIALKKEYDVSLSTKEKDFFGFSRAVEPEQRRDQSHVAEDNDLRTCEESEDDDEEEEDEEDEEGGDTFSIDVPSHAPPRSLVPNKRRMSLVDIKRSGDRALMSKLSQQLTAQEVDEYRDFFDMVDADNSNSLDETELQQVMRLMGMEAPEAQIKAMIGEVQDQPGTFDQSVLEMNFEEFLILMAIYVGPRGSARETELREAFDAIDIDGSGDIDISELTAAFNNYGSKFSAGEITEIMSAVDTDGSGEVDFDEFKQMMSVGHGSAETERSKNLKKKARSVVRALIMHARMRDAFASFDARYNFLRFSDASMIAPANQKIIRLHADMPISACLSSMRAESADCAPVYADVEMQAKPIGMVDMVHIVQCMLSEFKSAFKLPSSNPQAIQVRVAAQSIDCYDRYNLLAHVLAPVCFWQLRLDRLSQSASKFSSTPIANVLVEVRSWTPIRPGFSVFDVGKVLAKGIQRVPYVNNSGDLAYLIDQSSFIAAVNEDPRVRLGGVGHLTAQELGGTKLGLVSVSDE